MKITLKKIEKTEKTGEKIKNVNQTELDFALIMPEMDFPLNSA